MTLQINLNFIVEREKISDDISNIRFSTDLRNQIQEIVNGLFFQLEFAKLPPFCCKLTIEEL